MAMARVYSGSVVSCYLAEESSDKFRSGWFNPSNLQHTQQSQPSHKQPYCWEKSTEENYQSSTGLLHGRFRHVRSQLDYSHHSVYTRSRQLLQDDWILDRLSRGSTSLHSDDGQQAWLLFTAGAMGSGKSYTIGKLPLDSFIWVDPDEIRSALPEYQHYLRQCPERAGEFTQKEVGMVAELLTEAALASGMNVLVDGSLRDVAWYKAYFGKVRSSHPNYKLGIIHVTAPPKDIFRRVERRARSTGRHVPREVIERAIVEVPKSVELLRCEVDVFVKIHNVSS